MKLSHAPGIHTFDNCSITTGVVVVNRVSIEIASVDTDAVYIHSCITRWIKDGKIQLKFNCTEQEAFILELIDPE